MRSLGVTVDGDYIFILTQAEYRALAALRQASHEADLGDELTAVLRVVRAFLDARFLIDDMRLMVKQFEAIAGELPGEPAAPLPEPATPSEPDEERPPRPHRVDPHSELPQKRGPRRGGYDEEE